MYHKVQINDLIVEIRIDCNGEKYLMTETAMVNSVKEVTMWTGCELQTFIKYGGGMKLKHLDKLIDRYRKIREIPVHDEHSMTNLELRFWRALIADRAILEKELSNVPQSR